MTVHMIDLNSFNIVDWVIVLAVLLSGLISFFRGFTKEAFSLVVWVAAFIIARMFSPSLSTLLIDQIDNFQLRFAVSFAALFIATLIVGTLVNNLLGDVIKISGLSGTDRMLGIIFGLARGFVVVLVAVLLSMKTPVVDSENWRQSVLIPKFVMMEAWSKQMTEDMLALLMRAS